MSNFILRTNRLRIVGLLVLLCTSIFTYAQDESETSFNIIVDEIVIRNDIGENIGTSLIYGINDLESKTGERLDFEKVTNDLEKLKSTNENTYENVELEVQPVTQESIRLIFELQKIREIKRILIKVNSDEDELSIDQALRKNLKLRRGAIFSSKDYLEDYNAITKYYKDQGYALVNVEKSLKTNKDDEISIIFTINLGSDVIKTDEIKFHGNSYLKDRTLSDLIKSKESHFFSKQIFKASYLEEDTNLITKAYLEEGFIDVEVKSSFKIKKNKAEVEFNIAEGKRLELKSMVIRGNKVFDTQEITNALKVELPTAFSIKKQRQAIQRVRDLYGRDGYIFAQVNLTYDQKTSIGTLLIDEGIKQKIIKVEIIGNTRTNQETILENTTFFNGETVNTLKINESIIALYKTGFFKDVKIDFFPMSLDAGKLVIEVQENSTQTIQFSLGSAHGGAGFGVSLSDGNLFGSGSSIALNTMISKEITRVGLVYNDQHLFGSNISLNVAANKDTERSYHFNENKVALRVMFEKQITENIKLGLGTRLELVSISNLSQQYASSIDLSDTKDVISGFIGSFAYKTEGKNSRGEISVHLLPSFHNQDLFFKSIVNAQVERDLYRNQTGGVHRVSGRITLGYATQKTPFYERLQGGGNGTIRGFEYGSLNKDGQLGNNSTISANVTYSMPIYKDRLSGVLFLDAFAPGDSKLYFDDFRVVGGLGLKAKMDAGFVSETFEAGITIPLIHRDSDITKPFYFIIGDFDPAYSL